MLSTEVLPATSSRTLEEIADDIRDTQVRLANNATAVLRDAIRIGEGLLEAESLLPVGAFGAWCDANISMAQGNRANYMRLAYFKDKLPTEILNPASAPPNGRLTASQREPAAIGPALRYIRTLGVRRPHPRNPNAGRKTRSDWEEIRRLVNGGMSRRETAELLGVSLDTVKRAMMPAEKYRHHVQRKQRAAKRRQAAIKRAEQAEGVRKAKPDLAEAYALLRRCLQHTQSAHDSYRPGNARKTVVSALSYLHKAEDALATAAKLADIETQRGTQ